MKVMFAKLNIDWTVEGYEYGNKITEYGTYFVDNKVVAKISYHEVVGQCEQLLHKLIPERYQSDFSVAVMDVTSSVAPHTDSGILVTINHYVQTNDEYTIFYTYKEGVEITTKQIQNQTTGVVFDPSQLNVNSMFSAKENETWILDVTKPHSVKATKPITKFRKAIVVRTNAHTYEHVIEMLKETNSI
jgi:hypothetical protein